MVRQNDLYFLVPWAQNLGMGQSAIRHCPVCNKPMVFALPRAATVRAHSIVLIATAPIRWNRVGAGNRGTAAADRLCRRKFAELIRQMSIANPLWGAPRIHGEVLKLGIEIGQTSVVKYMARRRAPSVVAGLEDVLS
jgi:hypothetical protein